MDNTPRYKIIKSFGILSKMEDGCTHEFRLVNWNGKGEKYDIRWWGSQGKKASPSGTTLTLKELQILKEILINMELPDIEEEKHERTV